MKAKLLFFVLALLLRTPSSWAVSTDDFNRSNADPLSGSWTNIDDSLFGRVLQLVSNTVEVNSIGDGQDTPTYSFYNGASFANNQYSQVKISTWGGSGTRDGIGAVVRVTYSDNSNFSLYACRAMKNDGSLRTSQIYKLVVTAGTPTTTSLQTETATTWATTDVIKCSVSATTITLYRCTPSCTLVITGTDSALTSGSPGILVHNASVAADVAGDDWEGGDVVAVTTVKRRPQTFR